eukprot:TRINITY_DN977_c0_g2_i1.p1 TRINITY_DN977_c0_g2~~TRINITY_DN977_c0_g2_i1.p1  ORF type:complete len:100 (-),score=18.01 TRINITY_DN977_c0_g2_i1:127-426(-)
MSDETNTGGQEPKDEKSKDHISLRVQSQDGGEVFFKIKRVTQLSKLMDAYCQRQGINPNSVRFLYDGQRIPNDRTPKDLEMDDNDVIDAVLQQTGGASY